MQKELYNFEGKNFLFDRKMIYTTLSRRFEDIGKPGLLCSAFLHCQVKQLFKNILEWAYLSGWNVQYET